SMYIMNIILAFMLWRCMDSELQSSEGSKAATEHTINDLSSSFQDIISIENIKRKLTETGKRGLIYFGGHIDVNCKRMEDEILEDEGVLKMLNGRYTLFKGYVDEKSVVNEKGAVEKEDYMQLMKRYFNNEYTPFFAKIDSDGRILS